MSLERSSIGSSPGKLKDLLEGFPLLERLQNKQYSEHIKSTELFLKELESCNKFLETKLTSFQFQQIAYTCAELIVSYQGDIRKKSKRHEGEKKLTYNHLLASTLFAVGTYTTLLDVSNDRKVEGVSPAQIHEKIGQRGSQAMESMEVFVKTMQSNNNLFRSIIACLLHDSAEDFKGVSAMHPEKSVFIDKTNTDLNKDIFNEIATELGPLLADRNGNQMQYIRELGYLGFSELKTVFNELRQLYAKNKDLGIVKSYFLNERKKGNKKSSVEIFTQLTLYNRYVELRKRGIKKEDTLPVIELIDKVTKRKYATTVFPDKLVMYDYLKNDPRIYFIELGNALHNSLTMAQDSELEGYIQRLTAYRDHIKAHGADTPFVPERGYLIPNRAEPFIKKFEENMKWLNYGGYGRIDQVYPYLLARYDLEEHLRVRPPQLNYDKNPLLIQGDIYHEFFKHFSKIKRKQHYHHIDEYQAKSMYVGDDQAEEERSFTATAAHMVEDQVDAGFSGPYLGLLGTVSSLDFYSMQRFTGKEWKDMVSTIMGRASFNKITSLDLQYLEKRLNAAARFYVKEIGGIIPSGFYSHRQGQKKGKKIQNRFRITNKNQLTKLMDGVRKDENNSYKHIYCALLKIAYQEVVIDKTPEFKEQEREFYDIVVPELFSLFDMISSSQEQELHESGINLEPGKTTVRLDKFKKKKFGLLAKQLKLAPNDKELSVLFDILLNEAEKSGLDQNTSFFDGVINGLGVRNKLSAAAKMKLMGNPKYGRIDMIKDVYGARLQVHTVDQAIHALQFLYYRYYKRDADNSDIPQIKVKGMISRNEFIAKYGPTENGSGRKLGVEFYHAMLSSLTLGPVRQDKSSDQYHDMKIMGKPNPALHFKVETQIVLVNNINELGFSHHGVFEVKKMIEAWIRLHGYADENYIKRAIDMKIAEYRKDLLYLGNFRVRDANQAIFEHITNDPDFLLPLKFNDKHLKKNYYITKDRWNELMFRDLLPTDKLEGVYSSDRNQFDKVTSSEYEYTYMQGSIQEMQRRVQDVLTREQEHEKQPRISSEQLRTLNQERQAKLLQLVDRYKSLQDQEDVEVLRGRNEIKKEFKKELIGYYKELNTIRLNNRKSP